MKKTLSFLLACLILLSAFFVLNVSAETVQSAPTGFETWNALFAHAVSGSDEGDAWLAWQSEHDENFSERRSDVKYFFLPSSADTEKVDIYNAFSETVTVNGAQIGAGKTETVSYETGKDYTVSAEGKVYTLRFMRSGAEAAVYINNSNADGSGTDLMSYLNVSKSRSAKATGAIVTPDGAIDNTTIKKIKGRGNTTWDKPKKAYNITYDSKVSVAGMNKSKKYSILANYQDDSLSRNRFLYDLSDAVGMPYASDSRYVDFYSNGFYWGSYQMAEKVEAGASNLVSDFEEEDYLNPDGQSVKEDFPFVAEVDASAAEGEDYFVTLPNGIKVTIKTPELDPGAVGYDEVKKYVKDKFTAFYNAAASRTEDLSKYADVDSLAKLYLINELGKNWDSGASSTFFTYKPDENGAYKFYGSPVWDYDNSLGNAVGVWNDLRDMGVEDYEEYTGWWCRFKGKEANRNESSNIMNRLSVNKSVTDAAKKIWAEKFIPAINHFSGTLLNEEIGKELYTADEYYSLIKDSAEMNYTSGWRLNTGSWIADHTSLNTAAYDSKTNTYSVNKNATRYEDTFEGMYGYCRDWMISRASWLSKEMAVDTPPIDTQPSDTSPVDPSGAQRVYFDNSAYNWSQVYAYIYADNRNQNAEWPGQEMQYDSSLDLYFLEIPENLSNAYVIFTEEWNSIEHRYPADREQGMPLGGKSMIFKADYEWVEYIPQATTIPTAPSTASSAPTTASSSGTSTPATAPSSETSSPATEPTASSSTPSAQLSAPSSQPAQDTTEPTNVYGIYGDSNCDGAVNIEDVTAIQKHLASLTVLSEKGCRLADVDGSGLMNIKDATYIQMYDIKLSDTANVGKPCYN